MKGKLVVRETTLSEIGQVGFPVLINETGEKAQYRFAEFFISRIENNPCTQTPVIIREV